MSNAPPPLFKCFTCGKLTSGFWPGPKTEKRMYKATGTKVLSFVCADCQKLDPPKNKRLRAGYVWEPLPESKPYTPIDIFKLVSALFWYFVMLVVFFVGATLSASAGPFGLAIFFLCMILYLAKMGWDEMNKNG